MPKKWVEKKAGRSDDFSERLGVNRRSSRRINSGEERFTNMADPQRRGKKREPEELEIWVNFARFGEFAFFLGRFFGGFVADFAGFLWIFG